MGPAVLFDRDDASMGDPAAQVEQRGGPLVVGAGVLDPAHDLAVGVVLERLEDEFRLGRGSGPSVTLKSWVRPGAIASRASAIQDARRRSG